MGSKIGVIKGAAKKVGVSLEEYRKNIESGLKWCYKCKTWKTTSDFDIDRSRWSGLTAACRECRRRKRKTLVNHAMSKKLQLRASSAVEYEVKCGRMKKATELPCRNCGKPAREYHHHLGYSRSHWLDVIPLCKSCHQKSHWI